MVSNILDCKKYLETHLPSIYSSTQEISKRRQFILEIISKFDRQIIIDIASSTIKARFEDCDVFNRKWAILQREVISFEKISLHLPLLVINSFVEAVRFEVYMDKSVKKDDKKVKDINEICVPKEAMVAKYNGIYTTFRMPNKSGFYGYEYCVYNRNIHDSIICIGKTQEEGYVLSFKVNDVVKLCKGESVEELSVLQLYNEVNNASKQEYKEEEKKITFSIKYRNIIEYRPISVRFSLTNFDGSIEEMNNYSFFFPRKYVIREPCGNKVLIRAPDTFKISVYRNTDHIKRDIGISLIMDYMVSNYYNPEDIITKNFARKILQEFK